MLVQPQQAATVCELDLVPHTIGSSKRAQTLDPNQPSENSHEPLNLTLDLEYAHVSGRSGLAAGRLFMPRSPPLTSPLRSIDLRGKWAVQVSEGWRPCSTTAQCEARESGERLAGTVDI